MKYIAFALVFVALGCSKSAPTPEASTSPRPTPAANGLGVKQTAQPYEIVLKADGADVKAANAKLLVEVAKDGKPLQGADVKVEVVMPSMTEMGSSVVHCKASGPGVYRGSTDLPMAGDWNAKVTVKAPGGPEGSADYRFTAK